MIRTKLGMLGLCAIVLGVMAMSASAAQGATFSWLVLNAAKTVATELTLVLNEKGEHVTNLLAQLTGEKESSHIALLTEIVGLRVSVVCNTFNLVGVHLAAHGRLSHGKVAFSECEAYSLTELQREMLEVLGSNLNCLVKSPGAAKGTVETNPGKGELVLHTLAGGGTEVLTKIEPLGADFAELKFEECALTELNKVRGVLYIKDSLGEATIHKEKHLIVEGPLTALYLGAHSAMKLDLTKIHGTAWVKLAGAPHNGLEWGGMDMP